MRVLALVLFLTLAPFATARDKPPYEVGTFMSSQQVSDGTYSTSSCGVFGCNGSAYNAAHNVHLVKTPDGIFSIEAPVSVAGTFLLGMASDGIAPTVHKGWFMDSLHEGDKVLFSAQCNKHNRCTVRLPNPDKPSKEFVTQGFFYPTIAKTNAKTLCGQGKLSVAVEAELCTPDTVASSSAAPNLTPAGVQASVPVAGSELSSNESIYAAAKQGAAGTPTAPEASLLTPTPVPNSIAKGVVEGLNASFRKGGVAGYAELSGNNLIIHSERASPMRFHMILANSQLLALMRRAEIATIVYTDDAEQHFVFDLKSGSEERSESEQEDPNASPVNPARQCTKYQLDTEGNQACTEWSSK
jgi:hypothetical protein